MKKCIMRICSLACLMAALFISPVYAADADWVLNNAVLIPTYTNNAKCDNEVKYILSQITTDDMSTSQKVKCCYDWIINNCSYGHAVRIYDGVKDEYDFAYDMLVKREGVCDDYSAAFAVLTRAIGLNCRVAYGYTAKAAGGMTGHAWCVITVDGTEYVFDPQIDDNIARGGATGYYRYCKRYDEVPDSYEFAGYKREYVFILPAKTYDNIENMDFPINITALHYAIVNFPDYQAKFEISNPAVAEYLDDEKQKVYLKSPGDCTINVTLNKDGAFYDSFVINYHVLPENYQADFDSQPKTESISGDEYVQTYQGDYIAEYLNRLNEARIYFNTPPVKISRELCAAADIRAKELARKYSHTRPDGSESDSVIAENDNLREIISRFIKKPDDVINNLMEIESGHSILMDSSLRKVGIGYFNGVTDGNPMNSHYYCILLQ